MHCHPFHCTAKTYKRTHTFVWTHVSIGDDISVLDLPTPFPSPLVDDATDSSSVTGNSSLLGSPIMSPLADINEADYDISADHLREPSTAFVSPLVNDIPNETVLPSTTFTTSCTCTPEYNDVWYDDISNTKTHSNQFHHICRNHFPNSVVSVVDLFDNRTFKKTVTLHHYTCCRECDTRV